MKSSSQSDDNRTTSGSHQGKGKDDKRSNHTSKDSSHSTSQKNTGGRGFGSMDPDQQREIASEGGRAAHSSGNAHEFTSEEARAAGSKSHGNTGGRSTSGDQSDSQSSGRSNRGSQDSSDSR